MPRRLRHFALILIVVPIFSANSAEAASEKCETFFVIDTFCEAGKAVAGKAGEALTTPVRLAAGSAVDLLTSWVADTAQWILGRVVNFVENSTTPTLQAEWFAERYRFMVGLGALVLMPMLLVATIRALVTQDLSQLLRSFFVYLPVAILGTFVAVHLTQALLGITDGMSAAVARGVAGDVSRIFDSVGGVLSRSTPPTTPGVPSFAIFLGALLLIVGSFFVWLELLIRSAAVTVAVFFLPLILAGLVWPAAARWTRRLIEILVALILSKFVIVAVISLATAALAQPGEGGFGTVMGASALMVMAAFSPFVLLKLMPMVEGASIDHLQGVGRRPLHAAAPHGGVGQIVSVMRHKTRGAGGAGLAVAGTASAAGAAHAAGTTAMAAVKARSPQKSSHTGKQPAEPPRPQEGPRRPPAPKSPGGGNAAPQLRRSERPKE